MEEYAKLQEQALARFAEHQLCIKHLNCKFGVPTMELLGHIFSPSGVQPDPSKVKNIRQWPVLMCVYDIQLFLGMAGYYSCFVQKYANQAATLTDLLKNPTKWEWTAVA